MTLATLLADAREACAREAWDVALEGLLAAWRTKRVGRIADLIDRVAEHIPHEPVHAKTVKARTAAWQDLARSRASSSVGSLLATPWPGRWRDALALARMLDDFGDDPRIAIAFARFVASEPFANELHAGPFFEALLAYIERSGDLRARAILEAHLPRPHGFYWPYREERLVHQTVERTASKEPALDAEEEAAVAEIEALFAREVHAEAASEKSEGDFLAAIYAAPEDDTLRAVYADWLTERGDPRGEFITLQLTAAPTAKGQRREAALLRKHGAAWAGPFNRFFAKHSRVFQRGFLVAGFVTNHPSGPAIDDLKLPEWSLIERLVFSRVVMQGMVDEVIAAPWLGTLRSLEGIDEAIALRFCQAGVARQLEALTLSLASGVVTTDEVTDRRIRIARHFANVRTFGVHGAPQDMATYLAGPLPPKVERVVVKHHTYPVGAVAGGVHAMHPEVEVIEALELVDEHAWRFELRRDADGRFTRLRGGPAHPGQAPRDRTHLQDALQSLPDLTELVIEPCDRWEWSREEIAATEAILSRRRNLRTIDVPWDREVAAGGADTPRIELSIYGRELQGKDLDALWEAIASPPLSLTFDSMSVNTNGRHQPLEPDGLAHLEEVLAKKRTRHVALYRKTAPETMQVLFAHTVTITFPRRPDFDVEALLEWIVRLIDRADVRSVSSPFFLRDGDTWGEQYRLVGPQSRSFGWITCFGPSSAPHYSFDAIAEGARMLEGVRVLRTKDHVLVVFGDAPDRAPPLALREAFEAIVLASVFRNEDGGRR